MSRAILALIILLFFGACTLRQSREKDSIAAKEKILMDESKKGKIDTAALNGLLKAYEDYASAYADDTLGAAYLFKAADFYKYLHKPLRSIELYGKIYDHYPTIARRPYALFLQGFIFENEAGNLHAAKVLYEKFLKEYPTHAMAKDVQTSLDNLGKSPEQMIKEFEERARQDSTSAAQ